MVEEPDAVAMARPGLEPGTPRFRWFSRALQSRGEARLFRGDAGPCRRALGCRRRGCDASAAGRRSSPLRRSRPRGRPIA